MIRNSLSGAKQSPAHKYPAAQKDHNTLKTSQSAGACAPPRAAKRTNAFLQQIGAGGKLRGKRAHEKVANEGNVDETAGTAHLNGLDVPERRVLAKHLDVHQPDQELALLLGLRAG